MGFRSFSSRCRGICPTKSLMASGSFMGPPGRGPGPGAAPGARRGSRYRRGGRRCRSRRPGSAPPVAAAGAPVAPVPQSPGAGPAAAHTKDEAAPGLVSAPGDGARRGGGSSARGAALPALPVGPGGFPMGPPVRRPPRIPAAAVSARPAGTARSPPRCPRRRGGGGGPGPGPGEARERAEAQRPARPMAAALPESPGDGGSPAPAAPRHRHRGPDGPDTPRRSSSPAGTAPPHPVLMSERHRVPARTPGPGDRGRVPATGHRHRGGGGGGGPGVCMCA